MTGCLMFWRAQCSSMGSPALGTFPSADTSSGTSGLGWWRLSKKADTAAGSALAVSRGRVKRAWGR